MDDYDRASKVLEPTDEALGLVLDSFDVLVGQENSSFDLCPVVKYEIEGISFVSSLLLTLLRVAGNHE